MDEIDFQLLDINLEPVPGLYGFSGFMALMNQAQRGAIAEAYSEEMTFGEAMKIAGALKKEIPSSDEDEAQS